MPDFVDFLTSPINSVKEVFNDAVFSVQTTRSLGTLANTFALPQLAALYQDGKEVEIANAALGDRTAHVIFKPAPTSGFGWPGFSLHIKYGDEQVSALTDSVLGLSFSKSRFGFQRDFVWDSRANDFISRHQKEISSLEGGVLKSMVAHYKDRSPARRCISATSRSREAD